MERSEILLIVWLAFMVCGFLGWYFSHRARHKEKLLLIEKGASPEDLRKKERAGKFPWTKIGVVILSLSAGMLLISTILGLKLIHDSPATILGILGIFGGAGMLLANKLGDTKNDE